MAQQPPQQPFNGAAPPMPGGMPPYPPAGFPPASGAAPPFTGNAPPPTQPTTLNGVPIAKQPLNTTPSRTVYVSNLNEKVKLDGKNN